MDDLTKQEIRDEFVFISLLFLLVLAGLIGYFSFRIGFLSETTSMALFGLLGIGGVIVYLIFIYIDRNKSREMGITLLKELSDSILGGDVVGSDKNYFSTHGRYKDRAVHCIFINSHSKLTFYPGCGHIIEPSQILFNLTIDKISHTQSSVATLISLFKNPTKITENVVLKENVLRYKPMALHALFNKPNRKQKFINILDELVQTAETVESKLELKPD